MNGDGFITSPSQYTSVIGRRAPTAERPECGSGNTTHEYNTSLHVAALFLILILSTLACSFPIIVRRFPKLPVPNHALFISRHFGTGVLIATAFVHLLPTAYTNLTDPCLPPFWTDVYPAMAGFVAMVSVLVVVAIEMFFATKGAGHSHSVDLSQLNERGHRPTPKERPEPRRSESFKRFRQMPLGGYEDDTEGLLSASEQEPPEPDTPSTPTASAAVDKPLPRTPPPDESDSDLDLDDLDPLPEDTRPLNGNLAPPPHHQPRPRKPHNNRQVSFAEPAPDNASFHEKRLILQCLLLEAGILFHSVFIGMALSVSTGPAFVVLLIAISFHQTFEGLALGSRIAAIGSFSTTSPKPWLMSFMYGVTTPIGQAIGLAVHGLYDPASQMGLLMVGIVNAISSGLLLYAGLVQLLAEDFLTDQSYIDLTGGRRIQACFAVLGGSMLMSLVGAFA